ncbi:MAG: hypothetical protein ACI965_000239 [Paraglaciecola sp.]|jgi:hypothetical protein
MLNILKQVNERIDCSYDSLMDDILCSKEPLIFRGLINDWPLVKEGRVSDQAADKYLRDYYNQQPVHLMSGSPGIRGRFFYNDDLSGFNFLRENTALTTVLDKISTQASEPNPSSYYVGSTSINHILPGFREKNDIPALKDKPLVSIWIGNQSRIAAHYDVTDNVAAVAVGKRRFTLFPPEQLDNLYVGPLDFTPAGQPASLVDFHQPDFDRFPRFREALKSAQVAELNAGDAIFIPSMWWHHVEGLSKFNVLVNYWWRQVGHHLGAPADALNHALLSIRDLPEEQRAAWRNIFEHYVFSPQPNEHIPPQRRGSVGAIDETLARQLRAQLINKLNR